MDSQQLLKALCPKNYGSLEVESFETYRQRVRCLLPAWPECPLKNWLYRHYPDFVNDYAWLGPDRMLFDLVIWSTEGILSQVTTHKIEMVDRLGARIYTTSQSMRSWLQQYFIDNGTWPVPIIVLDNRAGIVGTHGEEYGQPYHLLEGHLRLGYLRNMHRQEDSRLKESHQVWLVAMRVQK